MSRVLKRFRPVYAALAGQGLMVLGDVRPQPLTGANRRRRPIGLDRIFIASVVYEAQAPEIPFLIRRLDAVRCAFG